MMFLWLVFQGLILGDAAAGDIFDFLVNHVYLLWAFFVHKYLRFIEFQAFLFVYGSIDAETF